MQETKLQYLMDLPLTDAGCADRLRMLLGADWKFVPQFGHWIHWDGRCWQEETEGSVRIAAIEAYRNLTIAIRSLPNSQDFTEMQRRQSVTDYLKRAESIGHVNGALCFLEGLLKKDYADFDTNPYLLNLQNGTLDLATGELRPHCRRDYLTKMCAASYIAKANEQKVTKANEQKICTPECSAEENDAAKNKMPANENGDADAPVSLENATPADSLWMQTVSTILPDPSIRRWMQKFIGYCLTGSTEEEKFVIAYGPGGCGKGTFFETIAAVLGNYKATVPIDMLLSGSFYADGNNPTPELAKLPGKRYVLSNESNKSRHMDEAKIKLLTGGDTITARRLHADPFEFHPAFKLILQTNYLPSLSDAKDQGIRRRLVIVPFNATIEHRDPKLKQKLLTEENRNACLAWCVEGAKLWRQEGLDDLPEEMNNATEAFYEDSDLLQQWLDERTEPSLGFLKFDRALKDFNEWLALGGNSTIQRKSFSEAMKAHGKNKIRRTSGYGYDGICLRS